MDESRQRAMAYCTIRRRNLKRIFPFVEGQFSERNSCGLSGFRFRFSSCFQDKSKPGIFLAPPDVTIFAEVLQANRVPKLWIQALQFDTTLLRPEILISQ